MYIQMNMYGRCHPVVSIIPIRLRYSSGSVKGALALSSNMVLHIKPPDTAHISNMLQTRFHIISLSDVTVYYRFASIYSHCFFVLRCFINTTNTFISNSKHLLPTWSQHMLGNINKEKVSYFDCKIPCCYEDNPVIEKTHCLHEYKYICFFLKVQSVYLSFYVCAYTV